MTATQTARYFKGAIRVEDSVPNCKASKRSTRFKRQEPGSGLVDATDQGPGGTRRETRATPDTHCRRYFDHRGVGGFKFGFSIASIQTGASSPCFAHSTFANLDIILRVYIYLVFTFDIQVLHRYSHTPPRRQFGPSKYLLLFAHYCSFFRCAIACAADAYYA